MRDAGHEATERIIAEMERKLTAEYKQAEEEVRKTIEDYFKRFEIKDEKWQEWVADGKKTKAQYQAWRTQQMAQGERWTALKQQIAADYQNVNQIARATIDKTMPTVYAVNHNYGVYQIEHGGKLNTSLTLYDHEAVERLMRDDPEVLPPPGKEVSKAIARGEAERWSRQKLQSVMTQGIFQGESIEHLATRLATAVGESNRKAAIRNARTMATNAQNAGRYDAYKRATDIGVNLTIEWTATLDNRTRHDHRLMHGQRREVGEPFNTPDGYEIMWPAELGKDERDLPQREIWNCRCTLLPWVKGFEGDTVRHSDKMGDMSYDEWLEARPVYNPIDLPEQKAKAIRESYIREYRGGKGGGGASTTSKAVETKTENRTDAEKAVKNIYDEHRTINGTRSVSSEQLSTTPGWKWVDMGNIDNDVKETFARSIDSLGSKYDSALSRIRLMDKTEYTAKSKAFAFVRHNYETDTAELIINPAKCKTREKLVERLAELKKSGYIANIPDEKLSEYIATHEYAHTIFDFESVLDKRRNFVNADYEKVQKARKQISSIYDDYLSDVEALTRKKKDFELRYIMGDESAQPLAQKAIEELNTVQISRYSLESVDEFMSESFALSELGGPKNKYAEQVMGVIRKVFGK